MRNEEDAVDGWPNHARFAAADATGHYESFFQRANHPTEPRAFWIRAKKNFASRFSVRGKTVYRLGTPSERRRKRDLFPKEIAIGAKLKNRPAARVAKLSANVGILTRIVVGKDLALEHEAQAA